MKRDNKKPHRRRCGYHCSPRVREQIVNNYYNILGGDKMRERLEALLMPRPGKRSLRIATAFWLRAYSLDRDNVFVEEGSYRQPVRTRLLLECCLPADVLMYRYETIQVENRTYKQIQADIAAKMKKLWDDNLEPMVSRFNRGVLPGSIIEED